MSLHAYFHKRIYAHRRVMQRTILALRFPSHEDHEIVAVVSVNVTSNEAQYVLDKVHGWPTFVIALYRSLDARSLSISNLFIRNFTFKLNWSERMCKFTHFFYDIKKKHRLTSAAHFSLSGFFSYFFSLNAQLFNLHKSRWNSNWTSARYYTEENNVLWLEHICSCIYHLTNKFSNLLSLRLRAIISKCLIQVPRTWTNKKKKKKIIDLEQVNIVF